MNARPEVSYDPAALPDDAVYVLIVDNNEPTRLGFALVLQRQPWVRKCLMASNTADAIAFAKRFKPAVALLDIATVGPIVAPAVSKLREAHQPLQFVLTSRCGATTSVQQRQVGACGFLPSSVTASAVVEQVRSATLADVSSAPQPVRVGGLTDREQVVLQLMATGLTNREIAHRLQVSAESIKKHASSVYRKLGVRNRTEATQRAATVLGLDQPVIGGRNDSESVVGSLVAVEPPAAP